MMVSNGRRGLLAAALIASAFSAARLGAQSGNDAGAIGTPARSTADDPGSPTLGSAEGDSRTGSATGGEVESGAGPEGGGTADAVNPKHPETYLEFAMAGGYLMIPLVILSVLWLTFLVERAVALRRSRIVPKDLAREIAELPPGPLDRARVETIRAGEPSPARRIIAAAATRLDEPRAEIEAAVDATAQREIHRMRRFTNVFGVIAALAPLLGLLGTVTGMIQAFREVAIEGLGSGQALAPGIYKALVTTAAGLVVAIPALTTHHWIAARIEGLVRQLNDLVIDFVDRHRRTSGERA